VREWRIRNSELIFWTVFVIWSAVVVGFVGYDLMKSERAREACQMTCGERVSRSIEGKCHCKVVGGWREGMPLQVLEEL
jgi:hypothetical protein